MKINFTHIQNRNTILLYSLYSIAALFCIYTGAIYSYDTYDYLKAMPYRQLGYVVFLKSFQVVFGSFFDTAVVLFQTLFSLLCVHFFYKTTSNLFSLSVVKKIILLAILIFPFFNPLLIANNLCTEGLSYGLYLLFVGLCFRFLLLKNYPKNTLLYYALVYLCLVFIRGQFLFTTLIFAACYYLLYKKQIKTKTHRINLIVFIVLPLLINISTKSYHYLKDGFFKQTPFAFINASTAVFYTSSESDIGYIENERDKAVFKLCYKSLKEKQLLENQLKTTQENYVFFHHNLPKICNQTVHDKGRAYLQSTNPKTPSNPKKNLSKAYFDIEATCKNITLTLIIHNFDKWLHLYFKNLSFGFYTPIIAILVILITVFSFIKAIRFSSKKNIILFLISALILSNAMLIAFASHSIMRYLFYNYALLFLVCNEILKLIKSDYKS